MELVSRLGFSAPSAGNASNTVNFMVRPLAFLATWPLVLFDDLEEWRNLLFFSELA